MKETAQEFEKQLKKKKTNTVLKHTGESYALNKEQKEQFIIQETAWNKSDNMILDLKAIKNNLESYSYGMRGDLDEYGVLRPYIDPTVLAAYLEEINQIVAWLYEEGQDAAKDAYEVKYTSLKKIGDPCKARKKFCEEVDVCFSYFERTSVNINN